ncbi:hypothetical protein B0A48_17807 [Cryoendolithus antarcticus]|uniref:F-box domain-containing protein n=1 Tax=Cryoendolithus antarcticus TaxID=1507870 RepID=A0A1V8SAR9_9PEZI|nr:hypothetical protein B0A48_17807 [Cryoendolithus antarcticus]
MELPIPPHLRGPQAYTQGEIPPFVQYTSPVATSTSSTGGPPLPLNLIARICSFITAPGDLARLTRTSRLLYYMCLPQLYESVSLHSYAEIRYLNGRPEGFGSGSPLMMALNGLVTGNQAAVVQCFRLWGEWQELGVEHFAKGRVPDNSMMLNILLRACVDKMPKLRDFAWELDCKPLKTLYQGLSMKSTLTKLTLRFPKSRLPRPSVVIPPIPSLKALRVIDIDPLCCPDDISLLLLGSKQLEDVRMHFSPRMRAEAEATLNFETYWGRCWSAGYTPKLKHLGMQNWYGVNNAGWNNLVDMPTLTSGCLLDCFGGATGGSANVYVDDTWKAIPQRKNGYFRTIRINEFSASLVELMSTSSGLEKVYIVSTTTFSTTDSPATSTPGTLPTPDLSPSPDASILSSIGTSYIQALTQSHGSTLRHLLLSDKWPLSSTQLSSLVRFCPNLTQLGFALGSSKPTTVRLLIPFLPKLYALRILDNEQLRRNDASVTDEERKVAMGRDMAEIEMSSLRWVGVGDIVYEAKGMLDDPESPCGQRREIVNVERVRVEGVEIWGLAAGDLMVG